MMMTKIAQLISCNDLPLALLKATWQQLAVHTNQKIKFFVHKFKLWRPCSISTYDAQCIELLLLGIIKKIKYFPIILSASFNFWLFSRFQLALRFLYLVEKIFVYQNFTFISTKYVKISAGFVTLCYYMVWHRGEIQLHQSFLVPLCSLRSIQHAVAGW